MSERITLKRDGATVRVVADHVERFKQQGWSEAKKPAPKKPAPKRTSRTRSKQEEGDE